MIPNLWFADTVLQSRGGRVVGRAAISNRAVPSPEKDNGLFHVPEAVGGHYGNQHLRSVIAHVH